MDPVAEKILAQLGGANFTSTVGANNYVGGEDHLVFDIPAKNKLNASKFKITLLSADTYELCAARPSRNYQRLVMVGTPRSRVNLENLREVFAEMTGL